MTVSTDTAQMRAKASPILRWLHEGWRVATFREPRWGGLSSSPNLVCALLVAGYLLAFVLERGMLRGHPTSVWTGVFGGWAACAINILICWMLARSTEHSVQRIDAATLFTILCACGVAISLPLGALFVPLLQWGRPYDEWSMASRWVAWLLPLVWVFGAHARLYWRASPHGASRALAMLLTVLSVLLSGWLNPVQFWWPEPPAEPQTPPTLALTDEVLEAQPRLLAAALDGLHPQRPGLVDVYAITYAPYGTQDVFMRESAAVAKTMAQRFDAAGRIVQLVDNPATALTLPWATPRNLQRAIQRAAALMDRNEDVLFLHLTSHGGADGKLATDFWPLQLDPVTPALLRQWLDDAGVRWRVISVSACYSGSWIAPLASDETLVMTAADADHTSYGCGSRSPLTFFGQAMYVDALQDTWSFEQAHTRARALIAQRELEAGKSDGYSNPQIRIGSAIRGQLLRLQAERARADHSIKRASPAGP